MEAAGHLARGTEAGDSHRRSPRELESSRHGGVGRQEAQSPALTGVCAPWGLGWASPPHHHTCLSRSLWVTPRGSVAKWGGVKLPGSSVSLWGGWGGPEACSGPSHPPAGGPRWPALQPDLSAPAQQLPGRPCSPPGEGLSSSLSGVVAW